MNKRLRLHKRTASPEKPSRPRPTSGSLTQEQRWLETESAKMSERVRELESFIVGAPRMEKEHRLNNFNIVPPPDFDFSEGGEHLSEGQRMSYSRQEKVQRDRQRNLAIFLALLAAAIAFGIWFIRFLQ